MTAQASRTRRTSSRDRLVRASLDLLAGKGPDHVTVDEVAAAAGVSKGTVYYQFGSKNDLVARLFDEGFTAMMDALREANDRDVEEDALAVAERQITTALTFLDEFHGYARLWISELWRDHSPWREQLLAMRAQALDLVVGVVRALAPAAPDDQVHAFAVVLFGGIYVAGMDASLTERGTEEQRRAQRATRTAALMTAVRGWREAQAPDDAASSSAGGPTGR